MQERTFFVLTDPLATLGLLQCLVSHVLFPISIWFEIDRNSEFLSPVTLIASYFEYHESCICHHIQFFP